MDCHYIAENHVADRYALNQLTPEEAELFEDHYMSCDACLDEMERAEVMARGFKRVGAEEIATAGALAIGVAWWRRSQVWMGAVAAAGVIALAAPLWLNPDRTGTADFHANAPVIYLQPERSAEAAPSRQLRLPSRDGQIVLVLELDPPFYPSYRAVVEHAGQPVAEIEGLELGERNSLTLSLGSHLLSSGDYQLRLEAATSDAQPVAVSQFAFRMLGD